MSLAAVVLNYRTAGQAARVVRSLQTPERPVDRVFVVDNASGDGSVTRLTSQLPGAHILGAPANEGFSSGCNIGVREALRAGTDRVLILNADVTLADNTVAFLDVGVSAGAGIVGPLLVAEQDPNRIESCGVTYAPLTGRMRHLLNGVAISSMPELPAIADVDAVSGTAMLIRREVFEKIGLFAEEFFYGFEDLEFCLRARAAGFRTVCAGRAIVQHEGAASIGRDSPRRLYFAARNHLLLASRVGPQSWPIRTARAANIIGLNVAHALVRSHAPIGPGLAAVGRGVRDYWKGRYGGDSRAR